MDNNSPIWRAQTSIPNSNTTTTKLSPPENETSICNGCESNLQSPSSPFVPSIHSEIELMDDDSDLDDGKILSAVKNDQSAENLTKNRVKKPGFPSKLFLLNTFFYPVFSPDSQHSENYIYFLAIKSFRGYNNKQVQTICSRRE
jgi:hypothetical protein